MDEDIDMEMDIQRLNEIDMDGYGHPSNNGNPYHGHMNPCEWIDACPPMRVDDL